jgi:hypothetical protein
MKRTLLLSAGMAATFATVAASSARAQTPPPVTDAPPAAPPAPPPPVVAPPPPAPPPVVAPPVVVAPLPPATPPPAVAESVPPAPPAGGLAVSVTTLRLMHQKGVITDAEYESAMRDIAGSSGGAEGGDLTITVSKFAATIYGFIESDAIFDSTQSFNDDAGGTQVARQSYTLNGKTSATTYAGSNTRVQFGIRNSRFGLRVKAPSSKYFAASGVLEMDFEGATLPIGSGQPYYGTEAAYFNNPTFRARHAYLKFETPIVDILMGQYWHLYGWSAQYLPNTVEIQGLPGIVYDRTTQIRVSHAFKGSAAWFEIAVAAMRPPQRNSGTPEGTAGFQLAFPGWKGMQTINSTGTQIVPASIAVTGDIRKVAVANYAPKPTNQVTQVGESVAVDALIPIIPARPDAKGNSLTLTGELSYGHGNSDVYTSLNGGIPIAPAVPFPNPMMLNPAPAYAPDIDPGIAAFDANGNLHLIQWTTFNVGLQYYLPGLDGRLFVSGNYSRTMSNNIGTVALSQLPMGTAAAATATAESKVRDHEDWFGVNIFGDPYPGVRIGLGYSRYMDTYMDGVTAINNRAQLSGYFIF